MTTRKNKYNARRTKVDGHVFDSRLEFRRYGELGYLKAAGEISNLRIHPVYTFNVNGMCVGTYKADFSYFDHRSNETVVEDCKSPVTKKGRYPLVKRLMKACHGIEIKEITREDVRS